MFGIKRTNYVADEKGSMSVMFSLSLTVCIVCVGVAIDYTILTKNQSKAQDVADAAALSAAFTVSETREMPTDETGFPQGQIYSGADVGHPFNALVDGDVNITFEYDFDANEVQTIVSGEVNAGLSKIMGHETLPFSAKAIAEIPTFELSHPASIALVIDNSNSMWYDQDKSAEWDQAHFDAKYEEFREDYNDETAEYLARTSPTGQESRPADTTQRIVSLKAAVKSLNTFLDSTIDVEADYEFLRMGLFPFNHNVINNKVRNMSFGTIPPGKVDQMEPSGETNTRKGLDRAHSKLNSEKWRFHRDIRDNLKRYAVLMTDGHNTNEEIWWAQKSGTGKWRGQTSYEKPGYNRSFRECEKYSYRTVNTGEAGETQERYCSKRGPRQTEWVPAETKWRNVVVESETAPSYGRNWKEGKYNNSSLTRCEIMKDKGWEVFTVGYALEPGIYKMNLPSGSGGAEYWGVSPEDIEKATSLLEGCASKPENFILATNAKQLEQAFKNIGLSIADDTQLRLK